MRLSRRYAGGGSIPGRKTSAWLSGNDHDVASNLSSHFDRLRAAKLEQAYDILVPDQVRIVGGVKMTEKSNEDRSDLRSCVVEQTKGREHDRQPNGGADRVRRRAGVRGSAKWIFEDDGYSGASLIRPGLERVRDLAAEGLIQALLVYAPDRLMTLLVVRPYLLA
jgi:hypothetical protein